MMVQQVEMSSIPTAQDELVGRLKEWTRPQEAPSEVAPSEVATSEVAPTEVAQTQPQFRRQIVWFNALGFLTLHLLAVYGVYVGATQAMVSTLVWAVFVGIVASQGVLMGAHRLYSHKSYKASPGLRLALNLLQTVAGQNCLYVWVRDHRQHHKWSDTDADPHNARRGFFFSHIGWLMCRKHPDVISKGKTVDMSDLEADPFVMFQKKYYKTLYVLLSLGLPVMVPYCLWGEDLVVSFWVCYMARTVISLNGTWLVNSAAHKYGTRPFTKDIVPVESHLVSFISMGEGWHNYHHTFPWDYKASELGAKYNLTAWLLERFADFGWTWDLRSASGGMVQHRILKYGDGTHPSVLPPEEPPLTELAFLERPKEEHVKIPRRRRAAS